MYENHQFEQENRRLSPSLMRQLEEEAQREREERMYDDSYDLE